MDCDDLSSVDATRKVELSCHCSHTCVCKEDKFIEVYDNNNNNNKNNKPSKQYHTEVDCYWPTYPSWPWTSSWLDDSVRRADHATIYRGEMEAAGKTEIAIDGNGTMFPTQSRRLQHEENASIPKHLIMPPPVAFVGNPVFKIMKFRLPPHFFPLLDYIVEECSNYASSLPDGWMTYLYSLTKQDVALIDVPGMYQASRPIMHYIKHTIEMYAVKKTVRFDRNQPHVLKYSADDKSKHTGVELHHDKCDVTANIMLSRSNDYTGGGTYFCDVNETVRLEYGEFLLHPGHLVHSGVDIHSGHRYLMIIFAHAE